MRPRDHGRDDQDAGAGQMEAGHSGPARPRPRKRDVRPALLCRREEGACL